MVPYILSFSFAFRLTNNNMSASMESLEDISPDLMIVDDEDIVTRGPEPESWSVTVEKKVFNGANLICN